MTTIDIIQPSGRTEWLELRKQDVTASVAGALWGIHPYTSAYKLWAEKTGRLSEDEIDSPAMRRGRMLEPVVAAMLREERPDWTIEYPLNNQYYRERGASIGCTPDSFATRPDIEGMGTVQFKTVSDYAWKEWQDPDTRAIVVPMWIVLQAMIEAYLTGAKWAAVAVMIVGRGIELHVIDIPLGKESEALIDQLHEKVPEFWAQCASGQHPDIDWKQDAETVLDVYRDADEARIDLTGDRALDAMIEEFESEKAVAREASKRADVMKPQIIAALGNAASGLTDAFELNAPTTHRKAYEVKETSFRALRIKARK